MGRGAAARRGSSALGAAPVAWVAVGLQARCAGARAVLRFAPADAPPLTEHGLRSLVEACSHSSPALPPTARDNPASCNERMEAFVQRVATQVGCEVADRSGFSSFVLRSLREPGQGSLGQMEADLRGAWWTLCGIERAPGLREAAVLCNALVRRLHTAAELHAVLRPLSVIARVLKAHGLTLARSVLCFVTGLIVLPIMVLGPGGLRVARQLGAAWGLSGSFQVRRSSRRRLRHDARDAAVSAGAGGGLDEEAPEDSTGDASGGRGQPSSDTDPVYIELATPRHS